MLHGCGRHRHSPGTYVAVIAGARPVGTTTPFTVVFAALFTLPLNGPAAGLGIVLKENPQSAASAPSSTTVLPGASRGCRRGGGGDAQKNDQWMQA